MLLSTLRDDAVTVAEARDLLLQKASDVLARGLGRVERIEVAVIPPDPFVWLATQRASWKFFWHGRGQERSVAAAGIAHCVTDERIHGLGSVFRDHIARLPTGSCYMGTASFDAERLPDRDWQPFGRVSFTLPRLALVTDGESATLALHLVPSDAEQPEAVLGALAESGEAIRRSREDAGPIAVPRIVGRSDRPSRAEWKEAVETVCDAIQRNQVQKVVLARQTRLQFDNAVNEYKLIERIQRDTPACYHALVCTPNAAFVCASPERLFRVVGDRMETEAVAGTRPRGAGGAQDRQLHGELLRSKKDQHEHRFVRDAIEKALRPLTATLTVQSHARALTLAHSRHLCTGIEGTLRSDVDAIEVLEALHPTPAVGGTPRDKSLEMIRQLEPFDRGLYAGPIGWIGPDAAEMAVGIRSARIQGTSVDLFAGAGIVEGSDPDAEWREVEHKMGGFLQALEAA